MRRFFSIVAIVGCLVPLLATTTYACTFDRKPSAFANGVSDVLVTGQPTVATMSWWARFAFPVAFRVGQRITFHENDAQVRRVLEPEAQRGPWHWYFSDGATAVGDRVSHSYRRPGRYRIAVSVYFPTTRFWVAFDTITITIRP